MADLFHEKELHYDYILYKWELKDYTLLEQNLKK